MIASLSAPSSPSPEQPTEQRPEETRVVLSSEPQVRAKVQEAYDCIPLSFEAQRQGASEFGAKGSRLV